MSARYNSLTQLASGQFGAVSLNQLDRLGIDRRLRSEWSERGLISRAGARSYVLAGSAPSWHRSVWCAATDVLGAGYVAGRTAARLHGLDGFVRDDVELLVSRGRRSIASRHDVRSTSMPLDQRHTVVITGIRCLTAERLILNSPLFRFDQHETENAIDSAIRLKLVSEQRLRLLVAERHRPGVNGGRVLLDAMPDTGGESQLERRFLALVRRAGLPRPTLQRVFRDGVRTLARVDALFGADLVVELAGHATHSSRADRQRDEQRRTELVLRGVRVITFTFEDVRDRPHWVLSQLRAALRLAA
ncbi:MAG TPA: hypothetical protein VGM78_12575 [Ilumatobacteraceae bacterium]